MQTIFFFSFKHGEPKYKIICTPPKIKPQSVILGQETTTASSSQLNQIITALTNDLILRTVRAKAGDLHSLHKPDL